MKILCTNGLKAVTLEVVPGFEQRSGLTVEADYASTNMLLEKLKSGVSADVAILTAEAIDGFIAQGKIAAGSRANLARSAIGIAVRKDAPLPEIATVEGLTATLLAAKSVAHSKTGISGLYAPQLFERLGIAGQVASKVVIPDPVTVGEAVARGDAELALQQISELMPVAGITVVGPLPDAVQKWTVFTAGVFAGSRHATAAAALIDALKSDAARPLYAAKGLIAA